MAQHAAPAWVPDNETEFLELVVALVVVVGEELADELAAELAAQPRAAIEERVALLPAGLRERLAAAYGDGTTAADVLRDAAAGPLVLRSEPDHPPAAAAWP